MSARKWNRKSSIFIPLQKHKLAATHEQKCLLEKLGIQIEGWEILVEPKTEEGQFDKAGPYTDVRPVASHASAVDLEAPLYTCKLQPCLSPVLPPAPSATGPGRTPCLLVPLVTSPLTVDLKQDSSFILPWSRGSSVHPETHPWTWQKYAQGPGRSQIHLYPW